MAQRKPTILINDPLATLPVSSVASVRVDFRFDDGGLQRNLFGYLTSGQAINVYVYPNSAHTIEHLAATVSVASSSYNSATNSFLEVLNGPFYSLEVRTVTSGGAKVVFVG